MSEYCIQVFGFDKAGQQYVADGYKGHEKDTNNGFKPVLLFYVGGCVWTIFVVHPCKASSWRIGKKISIPALSQKLNAGLHL
jgi:hypothetical protein